VPTVALLGPQRFTPSLGAAVEAVGVGGRLASVTAGWQEREGEDLELHEHLGERTVNLMLYARSEDVFERDPALAAAHRERQDRLRELQGLYRIRLGHAQAALRELHEKGGDPELVEPEKRGALETIRRIDAGHLERLRELHTEWEERYAPLDRPAVAAHRAALARLVAKADALLVAGGHVAVLLNRLRLFGFSELVGARPLFAWSAGAIAVSERVVLFHHSPPQGYGNTEILDTGLGLARGVVVFPHARRRLRLDDARRMSLLAGRFAPAECLTLDDGAWVVLAPRGGRVVGSGVRRLGEDGRVRPVAA